MKIITLNVNGIRAAMKKGLKEFIDSADADIIALQEIKATQTDFDFSEFGLKYYVNSAIRKGYSGTCILSRKECLNVTYGIGIDEFDSEGRVITAEFENFYLVNSYVPNSQKELKRLSYRLSFDSAIQSYLSSLKENKGVIFTGDLNVAHKEIDIKNPKSNERSAGFTIEERDSFSNLLSLGFVDVFRHFYPDKKDCYTWWSYMHNAREKNIGWRIDYFVVSENFIKNISDCRILNSVILSDHCPVELIMHEN